MSSRRRIDVRLSPRSTSKSYARCSTAAVHMSSCPTSRERSERSVTSSSSPSTESSIGASSTASSTRSARATISPRQPHVVLEQPRRQVHGAHLVSCGQPEAAGWMEVHAVRGVEPDAARRRAPLGRADPVGATEGTRERLVGRVAGLERDLEDAVARRHEPEGRPLEQDPAAGAVQASRRRRPSRRGRSGSARGVRARRARRPAPPARPGCPRGRRGRSRRCRPPCSRPQPCPPSLRGA